MRTVKDAGPYGRPTGEKASLCIPTGHLGKLSPEVTDELFIQSVRRTRYLSNKEKINRQLIRFLRNHLPLHGEGSMRTANGHPYTCLT